MVCKRVLAYLEMGYTGLTFYQPSWDIQVMDWGLVLWIFGMPSRMLLRGTLIESQSPGP